LQLSKRSGDHYADWGLVFGNPDFVACAQSYGAGGSVVTAANDLVPVIEAAFAAGGVQLVAVPIDYSENIRVLVEELGALNARRRS
jgi:acetolactate synthase I/II/III large subunit